jgi:hypothetical protein
MPALGRLVEHDPRSKDYPARRLTGPPKSVLWPHLAPVLDQGDLGSCTGNALAQCLNTAKFKRSRSRYLTETQARNLYSLATRLDDIPGQWEPDDTGSSGLAVAKAGVQLGYLTAYRHAFGFDHFLDAIQQQPVIAGTNWYDGMFSPDANSYITPSGDVAGGHEYLVLGANMRWKYVTILNSWGPGWARKGRARIRFDDFQRLLDEDGDVTAPIGR